MDFDSMFDSLSHAERWQWISDVTLLSEGYNVERKAVERGLLKNVGPWGERRRALREADKQLAHIAVLAGKFGA